MIPRVVHVASGREWRGGQRQVWLLARELRRQGIPQTVVTGSDSELARRLRESGITVRGAAWTVGLDPRVIPAILRSVHPPALLHAHDAHAFTLAGISSVLTRVPLVVTRRVDFAVSKRNRFWRRADKVIAISEAVANVLVRGGVPRNRIVVIHSGISLELTRRAAPLGIRGRLNLPCQSRIATNVAALVGHKDHATLLHAAKLLQPRFRDLHWVVAGEGELRSALETQVHTLGLDCVHLLGHVPEPERLITDSDLFVMSSREEGLGTSVLEAMALGIPVASTAAGGLPEMLDQGAGLLVPPGDPAALADAVARILEDEALRKLLVERASSRVQHFTDRRMAEEVAQVYRSCAHSLEGS
ncbi:MAG TPA: glycosyltransferase [Gemmatimonadales bacterium]|nr:glycosyltransferase [Gemmatimonadales bacterium]